MCKTLLIAIVATLALGSNLARGEPAEDLASLRAENRMLKAHLAALQNRLSILEAENKRLQEALGVRKTIEARSHPARFAMTLPTSRPAKGPAPNRLTAAELIEAGREYLTTISFETTATADRRRKRIVASLMGRPYEFIGRLEDVHLIASGAKPAGEGDVATPAKVRVPIIESRFRKWAGRPGDDVQTQSPHIGKTRRFWLAFITYEGPPKRRKTKFGKLTSSGRRETIISYADKLTVVVRTEDAAIAKLPKGQRIQVAGIINHVEIARAYQTEDVTSVHVLLASSISALARR